MVMQYMDSSYWWQSYIWHNNSFSTKYVHRYIPMRMLNHVYGWVANDAYMVLGLHLSDGLHSLHLYKQPEFQCSQPCSTRCAPDYLYASGCMHRLLAQPSLSCQHAMRLIFYSAHKIILFLVQWSSNRYR